MTEYLTAAETAKLVRKALREAFPKQKFYVNSELYSGGASIDVDWMNGPTEKAVQEVVGQFRGAGFDSQTDYKYDLAHWLMPDGSAVLAYAPSLPSGGGGVDVPRPHPDARRVYFGADFIQPDRAFSRGLVEKAAQEYHEETGLPIPEIGEMIWSVKRRELGTEAYFVLDSNSAADEYNRRLRATSDYKTPDPVSDNPTALGGSGAGGVRVERDRDWLWVYFPGKPDADTLSTLKSLGGRWSKKRRGWYFRDCDEDTETQVKAVAEKAAVAPAPPVEDLPLFGGDTARVIEPQPVRNLELAVRLHSLADKMITQIYEKRNPAVAQQNWTHRRASIIASMADDADHLERVQCALYALADAHKRGDVPRILGGITSRAAADTLLALNSWPGWEEEQRRMVRAGLSPQNYEEARTRLLELAAPPDRSEERRLQELEDKARSLVGQIPGFFPTPRDIALKMIALAGGIEDDMTVLEPSAGAGGIADVIRERCPGATLEVIEWNWTLREVLVAKGFQLIGDDFFQVGGQCWDRIVQNPPFENLQDIDHIYQAYKHLADGGRLVSVVSESPFHRQDKKAAAFRDWLDEVGGYDIDLVAGAFADSGTGIKARLIVVDK